MSVSDFGRYDAIPFAQGSLVGIRAFDESEGKLESVTASYTWSEGENVASCSNYGAYASDHKTASKRCSCGFYAYFDHDHVAHASPFAIMTVIEAYGRVTFGSLGFRAEKAKILAVYNPFAPKTPSKRPLNPARFLAGRSYKWKFGVVVLWAALSLVNIFLDNSESTWGMALAYTQWAFWFLWMGIVVTDLVNAVAQRKRLNKATDKFNAPGNRGLWSSLVSVDKYKRIARVYPGIPMYGSLEEMLKAFPPTKYSDVRDLGEDQERRATAEYHKMLAEQRRKRGPAFRTGNGKIHFISDEIVITTSNTAEGDPKPYSNYEPDQGDDE